MIIFVPPSIHFPSWLFPTFWLNWQKCLSANRIDQFCCYPPKHTHTSDRHLILNSCVLLLWTGIPVFPYSWQKQSTLKGLIIHINCEVLKQHKAFHFCNMHLFTLVIFFFGVFMETQLDASHLQYCYLCNQATANLLTILKSRILHNVDTQ